jgi:cation:H+ antiporter
MIYLTLMAMLLIILVAAEVFTNALEHLGERLKISEGVTGSLFAAVGTALPETLVPLLAIFAGTENQQLNEEIGVGAILGAPLMLSTLAMALLAIATLRSRGNEGHFRPEHSGITRDLDFFLVAYGLATVAMLTPPAMQLLRLAIGFLLVIVYFVYIMLTIRASEKLVQNGHATEAEEHMLLTRLGLPDTMPLIFLQLGIGLGLLIFGAKGFIHGVEEVSVVLGISPLLLSLLIIPIATELPEKVNSILWIRRGKDTLAFGNLTGAMVFQGTLLPAIGIMLTAWRPNTEIMTVIAITIAAALWLRWRVYHGGLRVWHVWINGMLYLTYLAMVLI